MIGKNPLNIGKFEVLPKVKQYENYLEFLNDYSRDTPNSEGVRIAKYKEANYLLTEFKKLKVSQSLAEYYYTFVTEIVVRYDPYGTGAYKEAIIDDPIEIVKFHGGESALGYDSDGDGSEFTRDSSRIDDWSNESSVFFLIRNL